MPVPAVPVSAEYVPWSQIEQVRRPRKPRRRGAVTGRVVGTPDRIMMAVPQPLWFVLPMVALLCEQPYVPDSVLPTLGATIVAAGAQRRLVRSRYRWVAGLFGRLSPWEHRWGMLLRLVDDEGRKWESRFLPVRATEVLANDPVFTEGWITRGGELSIWSLTNIRTGAQRMNRRLAVWPIVVVSVVIMVLTATAVL